MMTFGEVLVLLMDEKGISQTTLAERSGVAKSTICELIKGRSKEPTLSRARLLAEGLGVTIQELIDLMDGHD